MKDTRPKVKTMAFDEEDHKYISENQRLINEVRPGKYSLTLTVMTGQQLLREQLLREKEAQDGNA